MYLVWVLLYIHGKHERLKCPKMATVQRISPPLVAVRIRVSRWSCTPLPLTLGPVRMSDLIFPSWPAWDVIVTWLLPFTERSRVTAIMWCLCLATAVAPPSVTPFYCEVLANKYGGTKGADGKMNWFPVGEGSWRAHSLLSCPHTAPNSVYNK